MDLLDQGVASIGELYSKVAYPAGPGVGDGEEQQQVHGLVLAPFPSSLINGNHLHHQGQLDNVPRVAIVTQVSLHTS